MPGPSLPTVYTQNMTERINEFYGKNSVFKNNMFFVGLWGEYVIDAISEMEKATTQDPFLNLSRSGYTKGVDIFGKALKSWQESHWNRDNGEVELKWTCSKISIPTVESTLDKEGFSIDTIKPIAYPLIRDYGGSKEVTLTIVDNREKMLWHFFNTLHNQFYSAQVLKPKSSFHKLGLYCAVTQGDNLNTSKITGSETSEGVQLETGGIRSETITDVPMMVYEFNSAVITKVAPINYEHENPGKFSFTVSIQVPNTFQGTFKTHFRGLANNSTPSGYENTAAVDSNAIQNGTYAGIRYKKNNEGVLEGNLTEASFFESDIDTVSGGIPDNVQGNNTPLNTKTITDSFTNKIQSFGKDLFF